MTTKLANGASTHDQITKSRLSNGHQANSFHQKRGWPTIGSDLKVIWEMSVLQSAGQSGAVHQGRQERDQMDPIVVPQVPRQCRPAPASLSGLQPCQLHADAGLAEGGGTLVSDHAAGKVGQDRCESGQPWPLCHLSTRRGGSIEGTVPENPEPDRRSTAKTRSGVGREDRRREERDRRGLSG